jgi:HSP20 family protein
MIPKKRSFFDRLSGAAPAGGDFDSFDDELPHSSVGAVTPVTRMSPPPPPQPAPALSRPDKAYVAPSYHAEEENAEGQLPVDVYQTPSEIVLRAFVAGVRADELNVSISRDMVIIEGSRAVREQITDSDYFNQELFWGSFARKITLPQEVDVENSSANAKDGLLTIIMPKLDKARQTKLKVKSV